MRNIGGYAGLLHKKHRNGVGRLEKKGSFVMKRLSCRVVTAVCIVAGLVMAGRASAQRPSFGGRGGDDGDRVRSFLSQRFGDRGNDDRRRDMGAFFSNMRSGGGSSDDRRNRMQEFMSRMRDSGGSSRGGGGGDARSRWAGRGRSRGESKKKKKEPRPRVTVDLPEQFGERDRDHDGQIGLYEWRLSALAQFRQLDVNRDGFLTPRELQAAKPETEADADSDSSSKTSDDDTEPASKTSSGSDKPGSSSSKTASKKAAPGTQSRNERRARLVFRALDKDKDGKLTAKEWAASARTRASFKKAGVKLSLPVDVEKFVKAYPKS